MHNQLVELSQFITTMELTISKAGQTQHQVLDAHEIELEGATVDDEAPTHSEGLTMKVIKAIDPALLEWNRPILLFSVIMTIVAGVTLFIIIWEITYCASTTVVSKGSDQEMWRTVNRHRCVLSNAFFFGTDGTDNDPPVTIPANTYIVGAPIGNACFFRGKSSFPTFLKDVDTPFCTEEEKQSMRGLADITNNPQFRYKEAFKIYTQDWMADWMSDRPCPEDLELIYSTSYMVCKDPVIAIGAAFGYAGAVKIVATVLIIMILSMCGYIQKVKV